MSVLVNRTTEVCFGIVQVVDQNERREEVVVVAERAFCQLYDDVIRQYHAVCSLIFTPNVQIKDEAVASACIT